MRQHPISLPLTLGCLLLMGGCSTSTSSSTRALLDNDLFPGNPTLLSEHVAEEPILPLNLPPKATLIADPRAPRNPQHPLAPYRTVYFPYDSWYVTQPNQQFLMETADVITHHPHPIDILIEGHTDIQGTSSYNMILSQRRANAIHDYLRDLGIPPQQLHSVSYGETHPSCSQGAEDCHQYNRRVFLVFSPSSSSQE